MWDAVINSGFLLAGMTAFGYLLRQNTKQQTEIDKMHETLNGLKDEVAECKRDRQDLDHKFRSMAGTCPVTQQPCPLREMFKGA